MSGEIQKDLVNTRFLHLGYRSSRKKFLDDGQNLLALHTVGIQTHFMCSDVFERILVVGPFIVAFPPGCDMLHDQVGALLLCFGDCDMAIQAKLAGWVVDGNQALPLLNSEWLIQGYGQANHLTLGIKGIEIDVCDDSKRTCGAGEGKLSEVFVGEGRLSAAARVRREDRDGRGC